MTEIVIEGGYAGGFLDTIVDFNFGQRFATVTFQAVWDGDSPKTPGLLISIPQLGLVAQPFIEVINLLDLGHKNPLVKQISYNKEAKGSYQPSDEISWVYHCIWTSDTGFAQGNVDANLADGVLITGGVIGDIDAFIAADLAEIGSGRESCTLVSGPTTHRPHPVSTFNEVYNVAYIFNLAEIKKHVKTSELDVQFDTGIGPARVPGFKGAVDYKWTSELKTFGSAQFKSFPVSNLALPGRWPNPKTIESHKNGAGTPVASQAIDYKIPL